MFILICTQAILAKRGRIMLIMSVIKSGWEFFDWKDALTFLASFHVFHFTTAMAKVQYYCMTGDWGNVQFETR